MDIWQFILDRVGGRAPKGAKRSKHWRKFRKAWVKENPSCAFCSTTKKIEAHHIIPYWVAPDLELSKSNLMTLCRDCHYRFGHLMNWVAFNTTIHSDALVWKRKFDSARGRVRKM